MKTVFRLVLVIGGLVFIAHLLDTRSPSLGSVRAPVSSSSPATAASSMTKVDLPPEWSYWAGSDPMSSKQTMYAEIASTNELSFGFPYQGLQRAKVTLRNSPKYGKDVILSIQKGQLICGFPSCSVMVRWDEAEATRYTASRSSDGDSTVLFIRGYSTFLAKLPKAKKLAISATVYQQGDVAMVFAVDGFQSTKFAKPQQ